MLHYFEPCIDLARPPRRRQKAAKRKISLIDSDEDERGESVREPKNHRSARPGDDETIFQGLPDEDEEDEDQNQSRTGARFSPATLRRSPDSTTSDRPSYPPSQGNLKRQHFLVLNTILHRCVQDHEWTRAGRALGLLLRFELGGQRLDLRKNRLWGLAAEILLQRDRATQLQAAAEDLDLDVDLEPGAQSSRGVFNPQPDAPSTWFTDEGFAAALAYYDRLMLQYPTLKHRAHDVNATKLFPAFVGLWIFRVQARAERAFAELKAAPRSSRSSSSSSSLSSLDVADEDAIRSLRREELREAREIAARVDQTSFSPPNDRDPRILRLRGMVAHWVADLMEAASSDVAAEAVRTEVVRLRVKAASAFRRAKEHGADVDEEDGHVDDDDDGDGDTEAMSE